MSLTITTCNTYPEAPSNLRPLQQQLILRGIQTDFIPWQQTVNSNVILPLCAWDYSRFYTEFCDWINRNYRRFINPSSLMLWNSHKGYLCDLQQMGVSVIPSLLCSAKTPLILTALEQQNWEEVVIKPAIGQSGNQVFKFKYGEPLPDVSRYGEQVILQPFIAEVATHGETSLIFFNGVFSHAVLRQPALNEWRANSQYQVVISAIDVSYDIINQATELLHRLPHLPIYARVDGTVIQDRLLLNELELIEPALYLDLYPGAVSTFAQLIKDVLF